MCLLIVFYRTHPEAPLIVAANRDEKLARPAIAMTVLQAASPRVLGGRDEMAGGTWLAVNEHGVVAGLTNRYTGRRDPNKRSRGELPLALARHATAEQAVAAFARQYKPVDYNPSWLLAGDREALYYVDMSAGERPQVALLKPGIYVMENQPLNAPSTKADRTRAQLEGITEIYGEELRDRLRRTLRSHREPAACVHRGGFGTRSSTMVFVPKKPGAPEVHSSEGPPCITPITDVSRLWKEGA